MAVAPEGTQIPKFNDLISSDIVVKFFGIESDDGEPVVLHLHQSSFAEHSAFFAAQLSERWAAACTERDERGRPIVSVKDCEDPTGFAAAVEKLYELARGGTREDRPGEALLCFDDAVRCIIPADRLGLGSVFRAAFLYLENVAWTKPKDREMFEGLTGCQTDNPAVSGLLRRLAPPSRNRQAALWDVLVSRAFPGLPPEQLNENELRSRDKAREFISSNLPALSALAKKDLAVLVLKRLSQLKVESAPSLSTSQGQFGVTTVTASGKLRGLMSCVEWVLSLSAEGTGTDLRADVADMLTSLDVRAYGVNTNHGQGTGGMENCVVLLEAVADGSLTLNSDARIQLLNIVLQWAFRNVRDGSGAVLAGATEQEVLQSPFSQALATLDWAEQDKLLAPCLTRLMHTWQPWFEEWLTNSLVTDSQVSELGSASTAATIREPSEDSEEPVGLSAFSFEEDLFS